MSYTIHEQEVNGYTVKVVSDEDAEGPREWDNLGTMICFHSRYRLGDHEEAKNWSPESFREFLEESGDDIVSMPLYLYDHSGITINTSGFFCPWDSGRVGVIYATKETVIKEYGEWTEETREKAREVLVGEVEIYDQYLTGDIWGYVVEDEWDEQDSCWGFYGDQTALEEGIAAAKALPPAIKPKLCPVCGVRASIIGRTVDGRVIGSCKDAFTLEAWEDDE